MGHANMMGKTEMTTEGVNILLGDPKKAIRNLSIPIFFSLMASGALNITDMIWVSGLGPKALSAVGFFVPLYMIASALATGIGVGGGTCISQRIGAKDKTGAEQFAVHMFVVLVIISILTFMGLFLLAKPLFLFMGADKSIDQALSYSRIMTPALIFLLFTEGAYAIFRSEGNAKLVMIISFIGVLINMVLDPIFIFWLGLGVGGAAWASLIALFIATAICCFWLFIKKNTYIAIKFKGFKLKKSSIGQILHLGIPVSISQVLMAVMIFTTIKVIAQVSGENGVAVYSTGLRYMHFLVLPLIGISSSVVTVVGAAYGARNKEKMLVAFSYALKIGVIVSGIMLAVTFLAAPLITKMFTWSKGGNIITDDLILFLRVVFLGHPPLAIAMIAGSLFIGVGKSMNALMLEVFRNIILTIPLIFILGMLFDYGLSGIWTGIVLANLISAVFAYVWVKQFLSTPGNIRMHTKKLIIE